MSEQTATGKKVVDRKIAIVLGIICMILTFVIVGAVASYSSQINDKNNTIQSKSSHITNLQSQITSLQRQIDALKADYDALKASSEEIISESVLPPYTLISGRTVTWAFKLSNGELWKLHMPIEYYRGEIALEKPEKYLDLIDHYDQTWKVMDYRPFIAYGAFDALAKDVYEEVGDDEQFIYDIWFIVAQLTVYSSETTETPRWPLETLTEGGGDCEDTAILVASILQEIEHFTVELVYIDSNNPLDPHTFNHVIVWVDTGTYQTYIETTSKTTMNPYESGVHGWGYQV